MTCTIYVTRRLVIRSFSHINHFIDKPTASYDSDPIPYTYTHYTRTDWSRFRFPACDVFLLSIYLIILEIKSPFFSPQFVQKIIRIIRNRAACTRYKIEYWMDNETKLRFNIRLKILYTLEYLRFILCDTWIVENAKVLVNL